MANKFQMVADGTYPPPLLLRGDLLNTRAEPGFLDGQAGQAPEEPRDDGGGVQAMGEVGIDKGQQHGAGPVDDEGARDWQLPRVVAVDRGQIGAQLPVCAAPRLVERVGEPEAAGHRVARIAEQRDRLHRP